MFLFLTSLRLNSCVSDSKTCVPKYATLYLTSPTLLKILALCLMKILTKILIKRFKKDFTYSDLELTRYESNSTKIGPLGRVGLGTQAKFQVTKRIIMKTM